MESIINLNECYIGYEYHTKFSLQNKSKLPAKYRVVPQNEASLKKTIVSFTESDIDNIVLPESEKTLSCVFKCLQLQTQQSSLYIA